MAKGSFFLQKFLKELEKLIKKIEKIYGENLTSIVLFGSGARGEIGTDSDVDLLIVLEDTSLSFRERISEFWEKIGDELTVEGFSLPLSPIVFTETEAKRFNPLYLDLLEAHRILYDKKSFMQKLLRKIRNFIKNGTVERYQLNGKVFWRIVDEEQIGSGLSF